MLLRKALMAALVVAPFLYNPSEASAQAARAEEVGAAQNSHANQALPPGLEGRETLPPGILWTRPQPEETPTTSGDDTADDGNGGGGEVCISFHYEQVGWTWEQVCDAWGPAP